MLSTRTELDGEVGEKATVRITTTIRDLDGQGIPAASLSTLTATIYNEKTGTVLRGPVSVLNANGGTVNSSGGLTLRLDPADTAILEATKIREHRIVLLAWTWTPSGGVEHSGKAEIAFVVRNLQQVS